MVEVAPGVKEAYFGSEVSNRVPQMLQLLCLFYTVLIAIGLLMISAFEPTEE